MRFRKGILTVLLAIASIPAIGRALPFNDDMVDNQLRTGSIVRPKVKGTVPLGSMQNYIKDKASAQAMSNPIRANTRSLVKGKRLFAINCMPCHGMPKKEGFKAGVAGAKMGAPNLVDELYTSRTAGEIFATIRFGGVIMPSLGWKLSHEETWDIVNYLQDLQKEAK